MERELSPSPNLSLEFVDDLNRPMQAADRNSGAT
jgi:hypothetical protein